MVAAGEALTQGASWIWMLAVKSESMGVGKAPLSAQAIPAPA